MLGIVIEDPFLFTLVTIIFSVTFVATLYCVLLAWLISDSIFHSFDILRQFLEPHMYPDTTFIRCITNQYFFVADPRTCFNDHLKVSLGSNVTILLASGEGQSKATSGPVHSICYYEQDYIVFNVYTTEHRPLYCIARLAVPYHLCDLPFVQCSIYHALHPISSQTSKDFVAAFMEVTSSRTSRMSVDSTAIDHEHSFIKPPMFQHRPLQQFSPHYSTQRLVSTSGGVQPPDHWLGHQ
ncbi:hypothetical protein CONPUDRAFT_157928 [Coniophora puteana RWD-64-598 SS2]|uniref:Uncharacterized protein n=1 Tax=Coniophora puteana (strain RWD-64-598) TaxID=741705 RepID=A0A5M3MCQ2_CONPW|nr:uncharacterized protein CONPUDRAFT_157928 [Coniophora puteana RWD-64-598 SS2]EIW76767.1 hypothetical protein CONPUDRAFT_157928 [Coniophora puteana RWD-64-598 SS2]